MYRVDCMTVFLNKCLQYFRSNKNTDVKNQIIQSVTIDEYRSYYETLKKKNRKYKMSTEQQAAYWSKCLVLHDKICLETNARTWPIEKVASFVNDILFGDKNVEEGKDSVANRFIEQV